MFDTNSNALHRSLPLLRRALPGALFMILGIALNAQPSESYAPRLEGTVFNVKDYGAVGDDAANDTAAIRAALAACKEAGGGTVYLPAGTYRVAPTEENTYTFVIDFGNLTVEGDGYDKTKINFYAWDMQDPEDLILKRGGGFKIRPYNYKFSIDGVTLRGFRATGNATPNNDAGDWWGDDSMTGWDISHKGLGIWGRVDNVIVEDCEFDHWRGEVIYAGGGLELGKFSVLRSLVHNCNASAISMGGDILVEDTEIYAVHNGTECLSMGAHQKLVVRNCVIEPNRGLPEGVRIGKFGVVYLGFRDSSLTVEDCLIGDTHSGGVFLSEFAHNVRIANNTFQDTVALYGIFLNMYKDYLPDSYLEKGWKKFDFINNTIEARNRSVGEVIVFHTGYYGEDWRIVGNTLRGYNGHRYSYFIRIPGVAGEFLVKDNVIENSNPVRENSGPRPVWINNEVTGYFAEGSKYASYKPKDDPTPIVVEPSWPRIFVGDLADGTISRELKINPDLLDKFPVGFEVEIRRTGTGADIEGLEIKPDATWNTLERGYMVYRGMVLKLVMGERGLFEFSSFRRESSNVRTLTTNTPKYHRDYQDLSVYGQTSVKLDPSSAHIFNRFSGVAIGQTIEIEYNALTTIAHVPGVVEVFGGKDFVATEPGTLQATRVGDVLKVVSSDNNAPIATSSIVETAHSTPVTFKLPASDPDGDRLSVILMGSPTIGTIDYSDPSAIVFEPFTTASGSEAITFTVTDGLREATGTVELRVAEATDGAYCDSDKDGFCDDLETAIGSDPHDGASSPRIDVSENRNMGVFELHLPLVVSDLFEINVESSRNMTDWETAATVDRDTLAAIAGDRLRIQVPFDPEAAVQAVFFRLSASARTE